MYAREGERIRVRAGVDMGAQARACVCARVALITQHATHMRHLVCGLTCSSILFNIISQTERSAEKVTEHKVSFLSLLNNFYLNISHSRKNSARYWLQNKLKYQIS